MRAILSEESNDHGFDKDTITFEQLMIRIEKKRDSLQSDLD